jgi:hypothetical protein
VWRGRIKKNKKAETRNRRTASITSLTTLLSVRR